MSNFTLEATLRKDKGTSASRRLRHEKAIPAIVYGGDKEPQPISIAQNLLEKELKKEAFYSQILELKIDGNTEKVILRDLQRHPYKPSVTHADFMRIDENQKIKVNVPLHFINEEESAGVKAGGLISHTMTEIEVSCLPANLPEYIEVDLLNIELDQSVHMSEIKLPKGVELATQLDADHDHQVASIHTPKASAEPEESAEAPAEGEEKPEGDS